MPPRKVGETPEGSSIIVGLPKRTELSALTVVTLLLQDRAQAGVIGRPVVAKPTFFYATARLPPAATSAHRVPPAPRLPRDGESRWPRFCPSALYTPREE